LAGHVAFSAYAPRRSDTAFGGVWAVSSLVFPGNLTCNGVRDTPRMHHYASMIYGEPRGDRREDHGLGRAPHQAWSTLHRADVGAFSRQVAP
jgi:hypothetical protein